MTPHNSHHNTHSLQYNAYSTRIAPEFRNAGARTLGEDASTALRQLVADTLVHQYQSCSMDAFRGNQQPPCWLDNGARGGPCLQPGSDRATAIQDSRRSTTDISLKSLFLTLEQRFAVRLLQSWKTFCL